VILERISKWGDIKNMFDSGELSFFFNEPKINKDNLVCPAKLRKDAPITLNDIKRHLDTVHQILKNLDKWNKEEIKNALWDYASKEGRGIVLWALRYALSGQEKSPDPFIISEIIGKEKTLERIKNATEQI
jgi:glutamyl/glutaminyl-tRNA synthetase